MDVGWRAGALYSLHAMLGPTLSWRQQEMDKGLVGLKKGKWRIGDQQVLLEGPLVPFLVWAVEDRAGCRLSYVTVF